jgi:uncharacterized membrane protein YidH (DUF202 family)
VAIVKAASLLARIKAQTEPPFSLFFCELRNFGSFRPRALTFLLLHLIIMSTQPLTQVNGKRIALPVRVEPKVFFANERTFLSWLNFTVVLGGLAIGLLNFGDRIGRISAVLFTFIAMVVMLYALYTFHWRATKIRNREAAPYDDRVGPTVLCIFLLAAVVVNFWRK